MPLPRLRGRVSPPREPALKPPPWNLDRGLRVDPRTSISTLIPCGSTHPNAQLRPEPSPTGSLECVDQEEIALPVPARVQFAHASVQYVANAVGVDVLHIKGPAVDPETNPGRGMGTDADVLVRPTHVRRLTQALISAGWTMWCDFDEGSLFEHAASFHDPTFGMLDVHKSFPGLHNHPEANFDHLWARRATREIAGYPCPVLHRVDERLVLLLHTARARPGHIDVRNHWEILTSSERDTLDTLAARLGATVGLAIATGRGDAVRDHREFPLWLDYSDDRLGEWIARWRGGASFSDRLRLILRAGRVNRFELGQRLGRPPTPAEVRRGWWERVCSGLAALRSRLDRRATGGRR